MSEKLPALCVVAKFEGTDEDFFRLLVAWQEDGSIVKTSESGDRVKDVEVKPPCDCCTDPQRQMALVVGFAGEALMNLTYAMAEALTDDDDAADYVERERRARRLARTPPARRPGGHHRRHH